MKLSGLPTTWLEINEKPMIAQKIFESEKYIYIS